MGQDSPGRSVTKQDSHRRISRALKQRWELLRPAFQLAILGCWFAVSTQSFAQSGAAEQRGIVQSGSRTTYDQDYFAPFNPVTVEDILKRIPGLQDVLADAQVATTQRGFGSSGAQILFNGRRLSSKSMTVGSAVQRIQAGQVQRIEVIRGTDEGFDVRSDGMLVNVVLKEDLISSSGALEGRASLFSLIGIKPGGKVSYNDQDGPLSYVVSLEATPRFDGRDRYNLYYLPGNPPLKLPFTPPYQRSDEDLRTEATDVIGAGSLSYALANGDLVNVNGRYADLGQIETLETDTTNLFPAGNVYLGRTGNIRDLGVTSWELGGDYEHLLANGDSLKARAIYTNNSQNDDRRFSAAPAGRLEALTRIQLQFPDRTEKILQATYRAKFSPEHSIEVGAETALNDLKSRIQRLDVVNGTQLEIPLFNPDATVKETRVETFSMYSWRPNAGFNLEAAADTEYSRLTQSGRDVNAQRSFFFVKPRLDVRYDIAPRNQIRARIQRTISQLNFADFVSGFNTEVSRLEVVREGNPKLVPEKQWVYEVTYEYRLPADQGVVSLRGFYNDVTGHIAQIPTGPTILSATGNVGNGKLYGGELKAGLRLGWIGLPKAALDATVRIQNSKVTDPFDGTRHDFALTPDRNWTVSFRHDTSWRNFAYGASVADRSHVLFVEADSILAYNTRMAINAFAEIKAMKDLSLRLDVIRVIHVGARAERFTYIGRRGLTSVRRVELTKSKFPSEARLTLRRTF